MPLVAHAYNPNYSRGRDQEDHGLKPAWENISWDPISKNSSQKRAGGVTQCVSPEFKPQYCKKKERNGPYKHVYIPLNPMPVSLSIEQKLDFLSPTIPITSEKKFRCFFLCMDSYNLFKIGKLSNSCLY
jgi:hypothetical protein